MARWRKYSCRKNITFIKPAVYCQDETVVLKNVPHYLSGKHGAWNTFFYWVYMGGAWGGHLLQAVARIFTPTASQSWPVSSWCSPALRGGCECSPCRWRKREKQHGDSRSCTLPENGGFLTSSFAGTWSVRNQDGAGDCPALSEGLGYGSSRGSFPPAVVSAMCRFASLLALGSAIRTGFCSSVACSRGRFLLFSCLHFSFMLQPWFKVTFSTRRCFLTHQLH